MKPSDWIMVVVVSIVYTSISAVAFNTIWYEWSRGRKGSATFGFSFWVALSLIIVAGILASMGR